MVDAWTDDGFGWNQGLMIYPVLRNYYSSCYYDLYNCKGGILLSLLIVECLFTGFGRSALSLPSALPRTPESSHHILTHLGALARSTLESRQ